MNANDHAAGSSARAMLLFAYVIAAGTAVMWRPQRVLRSLMEQQEAAEGPTGCFHCLQLHLR